MKPEPQKATQQQTKTYNSQFVLKTIYDQGRISRADVARLTHLTRTTVSDLVAELQEKGLVEEVGHGPSVGGRSPILLSIVNDARHLIGIDLAFGEFRGAVVNLRGEVVKAASRPQRSRGGDDAVALVYDLVDELIASTDRPLLGIGIGTAGLVDTINGVVLRAVNLDWRDLPLAALLQARYNLPVHVANDSQAAALAEYIFGRGQNESNMIVVKVGHGIGAGVIINGQLFQGDGFGAGEIGHVTAVENGQRCRCGNLGCLETVASSRAILTRARELSSTAPHARWDGFAPDPETIDFDAIVRAFEAGDEHIRQLVLEAAHYLGIAAAHLVGALNIRHIVLVGSMTRFGAPLRDAVQEEILRRSLPALAQETRIEIANSGVDVVILGASALLLTRELGLSLTR